MKHIAALVAFVIMSASMVVIAAPAEIPIPRSTAGDKGRYFLLESKKSGNIVRLKYKESHNA